MKTISIPVGKRIIEAEWYSGGEGVKPAVIFIHDLMGIVDATRQTAEALSKEGLHVILPNLYSEIGGPKYCMRQFFTAALRNNEDLDNEHLAEIHKIIDYTKQSPEVDAERLGIVGQCLTGGFVLHAAIRPEIKAPVVFHHSFGLKGSGIPAHCSALIDKEVQGHFVHVDPFCPKTRVNKLKKELGENLQEYWYNLPHGIPHLFFNNDQGRLAFQRMLQFIKLQLEV